VAGVPAGISLDSAHLRDDRQPRKLGLIWDVEDPEAGYIICESSPCPRSYPPARFSRTASSFGEANGYVCSDHLGLSQRGGPLIARRKPWLP
tara:strand:- start:1504 stop:1779 length:276 start_codon:yes stop_codon:yes gene_type:complete